MSLSYLPPGENPKTFQIGYSFHLQPRWWSQWLGGRLWTNVQLSLLDLWRWWLLSIVLAPPLHFWRECSAILELSIPRWGIILEMTNCRSWSFVIKCPGNIYKELDYWIVGVYGNWYLSKQFSETAVRNQIIILQIFNIRKIIIFKNS